MTDIVELDDQTLILDTEETTTALEIIDIDVILEDSSELISYLEATPNTEIIVDDSPVEFEILAVTEQGPTGPPGLQGPQGIPGAAGGSAITRIGAYPLGGHRVVQIDSQGNAAYASNDVLSHSPRVVGITTGASSPPDVTLIILFGDVIEPSWNWIPNLPIYLGQNGILTQVPPVSPDAKFSLTVGFSTSPTSLFINIGIPIVLSL